MESDSWSRFAAAASSSSKRRHHHHTNHHQHHHHQQQSGLSTRYGEASSAASRDPNLRSWRDLFLGFEEIDGRGTGTGGDDESRAEFSCPFCAEEFDVVGLCCHIDDEHPVEAKSGVCPICAARIGLDLVGHMMMQHGSILKVQRRRRFRKGSSSSQTMLALLKRDLREGNLQSLLGGSSFLAPATAAPDPLLSSLIYSLPTDESLKASQPEALYDGSLFNKAPDVKVVERVEPSLSDKDQKERARRSEFVRELALSTIFNDAL